jgi:lipoprotein-anchoring transpeptidase ErfK/SrfK
MCRRSRFGIAALLSLGLWLVALRPSIAENSVAREPLHTPVVHFVPSLMPTPPPKAAPRRTDALRIPKQQGNRPPLLKIPAVASPVAAGTKLPMTSGWRTEARTSPVNHRAGESTIVSARQEVAFTAPYPPGSLVVVNNERALYHVVSETTAVRYSVAIGSLDEEWTGLEFVTRKAVDPTWYPVVELGKEIRDPVPGGDPANPLGARALYLGRTLWRIHGTPAVESIGQAVSNGCIRMRNEHVIELYDKVLLGTEVYVVRSLSDPPPAHRGRKILE